MTAYAPAVTPLTPRTNRQAARSARLARTRAFLSLIPARAVFVLIVLALALAARPQPITADVLSAPGPAPGTCNIPPDAPQAGRAAALDTGDTRLSNVTYRNGALWAAHTTQRTSPTLTVNVTGSGFVHRSVVQVNGTSRTTVFVTSTKLQITLTPSDLAVVGILSVTVMTPAPDGGVSAAVAFEVGNPATISRATPPGT